MVESRTFENKMLKRLAFLFLLISLLPGCALLPSFVVSAAGTAAGGFAKDKAGEYFLSSGKTEIEVRFHPNLEEAKKIKICEDAGTRVLGSNDTTNTYFVEVKENKDIDGVLQAFAKIPEVIEAKRFSLRIWRQEIMKKLEK